MRGPLAVSPLVERTRLADSLAMAGHMKQARVVWPTLAQTIPAFRDGTGLLTIGGGKNTMSGPSDFKCRHVGR